MEEGVLTFHRRPREWKTHGNRMSSEGPAVHREGCKNDERQSGLTLHLL